MTRKEALQELLAKVEAGDFTALKLSEAFNLNIHTSVALKGGSLDAAKALHDAVLPGYNIGLMNKVNSGGWAALVYPKGPKSSEWVPSADPARAWLIAIIKALISAEPS